MNRRRLAFRGLPIALVAILATGFRLGANTPGTTSQR